MHTPIAGLNWELASIHTFNEACTRGLKYCTYTHSDIYELKCTSIYLKRNCECYLWSFSEVFMPTDLGCASVCIETDMAPVFCNVTMWFCASVFDAGRGAYDSKDS